MLNEKDTMKTKTAAQAPADTEKRGRKASKEARRLQLIEATIDSLSRRGYSETTMADVADGAGLSRGIVNFHFESKENLLIATLQHMADEYAAHWRNALAKAGPEPADRMKALVAADFDRAVASRRKIGAWCAFWGEAKSRPTYQALCGARDEVYQQTLAGLCTELIEAGGYTLNATHTALALDAMLEGLWLRLMMRGQDMTREKAHEAARAMLGSLFPEHFPARAA
jgi:AcrR family transcriptional regulator